MSMKGFLSAVFLLISANTAIAEQPAVKRCANCAVVIRSFRYGDQAFQYFANIIVQSNGAIIMTPVNVSLLGSSPFNKRGVCNDELVTVESGIECYFNFCKKDDVVNAAKLSSISAHKYCLVNRR